MKRSYGWLGALAIIVFFVPTLLRLRGDYLWFASMGYEEVFLRVISYQTGLFFAAAIISFVIIYGSYLWTSKTLKEGRKGYITGMIGLLSVLIGLMFSTAWDIVLAYLYRTPFGVTDPVFLNDIAFYVFNLDFFRLAIDFLLVPATLALLLAIGLYIKKHGWSKLQVLEEDQQIPGTHFDSKKLMSHLRESKQVALLLGIVLLLTAGNIFLSRYDSLFSQYGAVFGIGYVDALIIVPLLTILSVLTAIGAGIILYARNKKAVTYTLTVLAGLLIIGYGAGMIAQAIIVEPDEFNKERQYLQHEIASTNTAYALDRITETDFPVEDNLSLEEIQDNPETIDNIRLWDWRPLLKTYNELQIFRTYYTFNDVDVDRYTIGGVEKEVMVSAREMDISGLPPQSQSWVNQHLVYTHGYGVTMSPVKEVSGEGLPELIIQDIPPKSSANITIDDPRIYYGESTDSYAIVNSGTREFDYPSGDNNVYTVNEGTDGVRIDSLLDRATFATIFASPQILFSASITDESRILYYRNIHQRVPKLAPFLSYDDDPYIVIADGQLYWIYDAYTTTDKYPYSRAVRFKGQNINYLRNSVKAVVDASSGETTLYVSEPNDPVIQTYRKIFPSLFADLEEMPEELQNHIRYPEDIFHTQSVLYLDYHMKDPQVFYNREDSWAIPNEVVRGARRAMEPYYIIMKLPGEERAEFVQILPFIPRGKENMIGWMAARSDPPNYGKLQAFQFSKQELIFGPMQIESRIDQDTEISQLITLWSQAGSSVLRGNLLAIPIEDSILYVEPLYLQSTGTGSLPELKQVIVAQGDRLTMQPTLEEALLVLFGEAPDEPMRPGVPVTQDLSRLQDIYDEAQEALRTGDFELYGQKITELGQELER